MDTLGAFPVTNGTALQVHVPLTARWVTLRNDSPNYIAMHCGPTAPANLLQPASYRKTIAPWSGDNYDTQAEQLSPFDGIVYLLPFIPTTTTDLATSGVNSSRSQVSLDIFTNDETPPQPYSGIARQQDVTSQPRVIALPAGLTHYVQGQATTGTTTGTVVGSTFFTLTAAQIAAKQCAFYLYAVTVNPYVTPAAQAADMAVDMVFTDGSGTPVGANPFSRLLRFAILNTANGYTQPYHFFPLAPVCFVASGSIPVGAARLEIRLITVAVTATAFLVNFVMVGDLDIANLVPVADIGNNARYVQPGASF